MDTIALAPRAGFASTVVYLTTSHGRQFIDITDQILAHVADSGIANGMLVVASQHTTGAVIVNEHEPELLRDLEKMLAEMAPEDADYRHNGVPCGRGERPNGHSHCQALLLTTSTTLPVVGGAVALGRWQRVFFIELDGARERQVSIMVVGV